MKNSKQPKVTKHKLGVDSNEPAAKARKSDPNFSQSRDIHEDRGTVQSHMGQKTNAVGRGRGKKTS